MSQQNMVKYTSLKNIQILIALLKQYGVRHIVLSPGGRNVPFVHSVEQDSFFSCYSVVDERSAAFFGIGLIHSLKEPVAICCTSATAVCNYMSAVHEAYYQQLPLIVLTADRPSCYLNQSEEQMIPQKHIFGDICKKEVSLPIVKDAIDEWYCGRVVNEALSAAGENYQGPVHINFEVEDIAAPYDVERLPEVARIHKIYADNIDDWKRAGRELADKKIMLIFGQHLIVEDEEKQLLEKFCERYDVVLCTDLLSNVHCRSQMNTSVLANTCSQETLNELLPDIVITMGGNYVSGIRNWLKGNVGRFSHWDVSVSGEIADPFQNLHRVFVCKETEFLLRFSEFQTAENHHKYREQWFERQKAIAMPDFPYSSAYAVKQMFSNLPSGVKLHIANSNSIRIAQMFPVADDIEVFCNRGCNGIDGSMSSFVGMASVRKELCYLLIGDLSFFYDVNALWNRHIGNNIRIMLLNNSGASIFHVFPTDAFLPTIDDFTAARHSQTAAGWALSCGFKYIKANGQDEFDENLAIFNDTASDKPVLFEVFTDKKKDAALLTDFYNKSKVKNLLSGKKGTLMRTALKKVIK